MNKIKVLVVEDEQLTALFIKTLLEDNGYIVAGMAMTGEDAITQALASRPDLILMDILLPGEINGIDAAHAISRKMEVPVVFLTACCDSSTVEDSKKSDPFGYLIKPFEIKDLLTTVSMALYRYDLERKLRESERRFRLLFEQETDAIIIFDTASRAIADVNEAVLHLYGYEKDELVGMDLMLLMDNENYASLYRAFTDDRDGSTFILLRQEHRKKNGEAVPVSCRGRMIELNGRQHLFCSVRDITERLRHEEEAAMLQAQVVQSEKMASIGLLAAGIVHEINNPMAFISSNLSTMDKYAKRMKEFIGDLVSIVETGSVSEALEKMNEKKRELKIDRVLQDVDDLISESVSGVERVRKITQDLKLFARAEDEELKLADVHECIDQTINIIWNELKYTSTLKKDYGDIPHIRCHPQQLSQVVMNLLVNAAHAIKKDGIITIKTWQENENVCISITDTGCGISEKNLTQIFEPFFTTKEIGVGTGLGLSIAYDIITKKHNGRLTVASKVGDGTTFTIKLPYLEP